MPTDTSSHPFHPLLSLTQWQRAYLNALYLRKQFTMAEDFNASCGHVDERKALIDAGYIIPVPLPGRGWMLNPRAIPAGKNHR